MIIRRINRLPYDTKIQTKFLSRNLNYRDAPSIQASSAFPERILTGVHVYLEFSVSRQEFDVLIKEIDISSRNKFITYTELDVPWLVYCEPHRMIHRPPEPTDIVDISIDNFNYKVSISIDTCPTKDCRIPVTATVLLNECNNRVHTAVPVR